MFQNSFSLSLYMVWGMKENKRRNKTNSAPFLFPLVAASLRHPAEEKEEDKMNRMELDATSPPLFIHRAASGRRRGVKENEMKSRRKRERPPTRFNWLPPARKREEGWNQGNQQLATAQGTHTHTHLPRLQQVGRFLRTTTTNNKKTGGFLLFQRRKIFHANTPVELRPSVRLVGTRPSLVRLGLRFTICFVVAEVLLRAVWPSSWHNRANWPISNRVVRRPSTET